MPEQRAPETVLVSGTSLNSAHRNAGVLLTRWQTDTRTDMLRVGAVPSGTRVCQGYTAGPGIWNVPPWSRSSLTSATPRAAAAQTPAIGRETLYAMGYLGLFPVLEGVLDERLKVGDRGAAFTPRSDTVTDSVRLC